MQLAWKVTVVWIVPRCRLLTPFQEGIYHKLFSQEKNLNSARWQVVDILINFMLSLAKS